MIGHYPRFRENDNLPRWPDPAVKKRLKDFNVRPYNV